MLIFLNRLEYKDIIAIIHQLQNIFYKFFNNETCYITKIFFPFRNTVLLVSNRGHYY